MNALAAWGKGRFALVCQGILLLVLLLASGLVVAEHSEKPETVPTKEATAQTGSTASEDVKPLQDATGHMAPQPVLASSPVKHTGKVLIFLVLIIGIILLMAWLANKMRAQQWVKADKHLSTLAVLPLGVKEKIALIQVGEQQIVVGVTPQQITHLTTLEDNISVSQEGSAPFSELLKAAIKK